MSKEFSRSILLFKKNGIKMIWGTISFACLCFLLDSVLGVIFGERYSSLYMIVIPSTIGYIYNALSQAKGESMVNALMSDWVDLPIIKHLVIIVSSILAVIYIKLLVPLLNQFFTKKMGN